jgi:hypothetical protein
MTDESGQSVALTIGLDAQKRVREYVRNVVLSTIMARSDRDLQSLPGPSDLADQCDRCLGLCLGRAIGVVPQSNNESFSLKAWTGTAVHEKLERDVPKYFPKAIPESTVTVHQTEGFGTIEGHIDLRLSEVDYAPNEYCSVWVDYKTTDMVKLRKYKSEGVPTSHVGQTMLYGYGLRRSGLKADVACLVYIPRDSNRVEDVWEASCEYREDIAVRYLKRAEDLLRHVRQGNVYLLPSDPDCFVCSARRRFS